MKIAVLDTVSLMGGTVTIQMSPGQLAIRTHSAVDH